MSYRSKVAIVFDKTALTQDQQNKAKEILALLCKEDYNLIKQNETYLQFYHEYYKWNDLDEDIQFLYKFLGEIPEESYSFLRTGEEYGDLERKGSSEFGLSYLFTVDPVSLPLEVN
jgi:hypothetical protein